jgi:hypothetical protein
MHDMGGGPAPSWQSFTGEFADLLKPFMLKTKTKATTSQSAIM